MISLHIHASFLGPKNHYFAHWNHGIRDELLLRKRRRRPDVRVRLAFDELFRNVASTFPSPASLDLLLAPVLGFASGAAAIYLSSRAREKLGGYDGSVAGDWILFTSPTPFNRSVLLRCPSVSFEDGGELFDGVNERLVTEERHYVNVTRGSIPTGNSEDGSWVDEVSYQRICVLTDDGGVISLDWPENLELGKEHGLDTTVLIVPGTTQGSLDQNVKFFVYDALKHGYFPIVMNPRGCAGSPLTTARLFTAADSDDICKAIEFVSRLRPWTTYMMVGWGYGANMLTKYLAEVGEATPLTAAVCIDTPFDLAEATTSFPHHIALEQKLRRGLVDILQANKELFQGKTKGFDMGKALSATSLREFDQAISMVSYGCKTIDEFYSKISTIRSIGKLKVPVLFIQSDDGTVPLFSVPRSSIAENPNTSLLLCSCLPSSVIRRDSSAILWCHNIAIEWLSAVEFALLKGRHPLVKDVDVTINPTRGSSFVDRRMPGRNFVETDKFPGSYDPAKPFISFNKVNGDSILKLKQSNPANKFLVDQLNTGFMSVGAPVENNSSLNSRKVMQKLDGTQNERMEDENNVNDYQQNNDENNVDMMRIDGEESGVSRTASVVVNMLDVTMPGTLDEEQKKKVMTAVGQGETLMKALEGAVPEDVRGKLTSAVSEILQTHGKNLNLQGFKGICWVPNVSSKIKSTIEDNTKDQSKNIHEDNGNHSSGASHDGLVELDTTPLNPSNNIPPETTAPSDQGNAQTPEFVGARPKVQSILNESNSSEKFSDVVDESGAEQKISQIYADENLTVDDQEAHNQLSNIDERKRDIEEPNIPTSSVLSGELPPAQSVTSVNNAMERVGNNFQKNEVKASQNIDEGLSNSSVKPENSSTLHPTPQSPEISVTQALDVLTGLDDGTQMAVTSVFGVLENMIDQLEKSNNGQSKDEANPDDTEKHKLQVLSSETLPVNDIKPGNIELHGKVSNLGQHVKHALKQKQEIASEKKASQFHDVVEIKLGHQDAPEETQKGKCTSSQESIIGLDQIKLNNSAIIGAQQNVTLDIATNPYYWGSPYSAYLQSYLSTQLQKTKSSDIELATDLFLDPEEGRWKMLDYSTISDSVVYGAENQIANEDTFDSDHLSPAGGLDKIIEPSYVVLDAELPKAGRDLNGCFDAGVTSDHKEEIKLIVKKSLLESLRFAVGRRFGMSNFMDMEVGLMDDLEQIAETISIASLLDCQLNIKSPSDFSASSKIGIIEGQDVIKTISSAVQDASHLKKVLPVGVVVGTVLASLGNYFHFADLSTDDHSIAIQKSESIQEKILGEESDTLDMLTKNEKKQHSDATLKSPHEENVTQQVSNEGVMVGAVTAALGASVLFAHSQQSKIVNGEGAEESSTEREWKNLPYKEHARHEEAQDKNQNSIMSSFAEKAMSVAAPVVPTKGDGQVDQDRLVAILSEIGQKGGILRFVGKIALLWGGIRGAMSLTDRLISFLRIAERPLLQRILAFGCMVLLLWSPMVIPLLPTLVLNWTMSTPSGFALYACIIGLYVSVMILIVLWGKRIRGYENPLEQYGLDISSLRANDFLKGLGGGILMVLIVHTINACLGLLYLSWPLGLPTFSADPRLLFKEYVSVFFSAVRGAVTASCIALVEELLFRSWLHEELTADLGFYQAILISAVAFSLIHSSNCRSLPSVPGLFLLSLALFGIKQRSENKISSSIGIRTGIIMTNFTLVSGGFIRYKANAHFWLIVSHPMHPFDNAVGLGICTLLAILFFPQYPQKSVCTPDQE